MAQGGEAEGGGWSGEELDAAMSNLVERGALELPPYPAVAFKIEQLVTGGDFGLDDLARLVGSDPAMAADVLRCANTAAFARGAPVASVPQAVARIGAAELWRIVLTSALGARALAGGPLAVLRRRAWHDSVAAGVLGRELARPRRVPPDEAFACGLLHDFGKVLAIECLERLGRGTRPPPRLPARFWTAVVEQHHLRLGGILAERWGLPELIAEAMTLHHQEPPGRARHVPMMRVMAVCDRIIRLLDDQAAVSAQDVAAVQSLTPEDTEALVRGIEVVPAFVAAFERDAAPDEVGLLLPPAPPRAAALPGGLRLRTGASTYAITGFAPGQLVLSGEQPLAEGALLEVALDEVGAVPFHARVMLCWHEGGRHGVVLMPFALGGEALLRWQGLAALAQG
jgi:HD-like signal output (HDOD) protein